MNKHIFEASKNIREYFRSVDSAFKAPCAFLDASYTFWTRRRNILLYFNVIFDASKKTLNYSSIFLRRVKMYRTRRRNMLLYFNVILDAFANFPRVENYIYDPSVRIIKNPLNSTTFLSCRLNSATCQLNSATRQILH